MKPNELRLFISSTFRDLQEEREHLLKKVFPLIRAVCSQRGVTFTEIDLRWGITEEEGTLGRIIRTCLEEIDRCRPFFIGILGDRYGWIPDSNAIQKDAELLRNYPWIDEIANEGASIVEMEFTYGALMEDFHSGHALFYRRVSPNALREEASGEASDDQQKLEGLVRRTINAGYPITNFATPMELADAVRRDLLAMIDERWPALPILATLETERKAHEAFAVTRRYAYITIPHYSNQVLLWLQSGTEQGAAGAQPPLVIVGPSGSGKSSLVAHLHGLLLRRFPRYRAVVHYVGAARTSSDHIGIMRHVMEEINDLYGNQTPIPDSPEEIEAKFPEWLAHVPEDRPLLLLIDALNQIEEPGDQLRWLPEYIPPSVRLIVSTIPNDSAQRLIERGWKSLELRPLDVAEREAMVVRYLGEYHKGLSPQAVRAIASHQQTASPLFLRTLLEELRLCGDYHLLGRHLEYYLQAQSPQELFGCVMERMERDYGQTVVCNALSLIACSRHGLAEHDLLEISSISRLDLSTLLHALDFHLIHRDGVLDFFHEYLREAVEARYLTNPETRQQYHLHIAEFFQQKYSAATVAQPLPWMVALELPWQWSTIGDTARLHDAIASLPITLPFVATDHTYELLRYWLQLGNLEQMEQAYCQQLEGLRQSRVPPAEVATVAIQLSKIMMVAGRYAGAADACQVALELQQQHLPWNKREVAETMNELGMVLVQQGKFQQAEPLLREALSLQEGEHHDHLQHDLQQANTLYSLAQILYLRKEYHEAEQAFLQVLAIREKVLGSRNQLTVRSRLELGAVYYGIGWHDRAEALFTDVRRLATEMYGSHHPLVAESTANVGAVLIAQNRLDEAIAAYRQAIESYETMIGQDHPSLALLWGNMGTALHLTGSLAEAEAALRHSIGIDRRHYGNNHHATATHLMSLGNILRDKTQYAEAVDYHQQVFEIRCHIFGNNHISTAHAATALARSLFLCGDLQKARSLYEKYQPIKTQILGSDHPQVQLSQKTYDELMEQLSLPAAPQ
ncbi:MAG: tetratricopeptide repeat protein [Armatimonadetes bacterium]|nr:tetratricopeptide repeat protein [Armatimonadota bacterium]